MEIGKFDIAPTCSRELFSDRCPCVSSRACRLVRAISCVPPRAFRLVRAVSRVLSCACRLVRAVSCVPPRAFRLVRAVSRVLSCACRLVRAILCVRSRVCRYARAISRVRSRSLIANARGRPRESSRVVRKVLVEVLGVKGRESRSRLGYKGGV